jgi:hypothetical protein
VSHHLATRLSGIPRCAACTRFTGLDMLPAMSGGPAERRAAIAVVLMAMISWIGKHAERRCRHPMLAGAPAT